MLTTDHVHV